MVKKYHTEEERLEARRLSKRKHSQKIEVKLKNRKRSQERREKIKSDPIELSKSRSYQRTYYKKPERAEKNKIKYSKQNEKKRLERIINPEKFKELDRKERDRIKENSLRLNRRREYLRNWQGIQRNTNLFHRLRLNLTNRISQSLKRKNSIKKANIYFLIGCSKDQLIKHLESKFYENKETNEVMTWDNYGRGGWEVDHKMPIDSFKDQDITSLETQKKIMHYTNLQPMWGNENRAKSNKILND
jgi:hypothetical protein